MLRFRNQDHRGGINMPRKLHKLKGRKASEIEKWVHYCGHPFVGILSYMKGEKPDDAWDGPDPGKFYRENKAAILKIIDKKNKSQGRPFFRPQAFWEELEKELREDEEWTMHCDSNFPYDRRERLKNAYILNRLGLLEPWEMEIFEAENDA